MLPTAKVMKYEMIHIMLWLYKIMPLDILLTQLGDIVPIFNLIN